VSLSDRYNFVRPAPSIPIPTDRGIKLRSQRGSVTKNWWARRWIDAMERLVDPARLQRGRSYARSGQVLSIQETRAGIEALVQGSRPQPYKVTIQVTHLSNHQWNLVVDALSEQALFTAQLLAGEMPGNIESAFETAGVSLFPNRGGDLNTNCSCPDWANPCKHVAASHYILGDRFDDDPFLLFRMRGRSQEQIMDALRKRRGGIALEAEGTQEIVQPAPGLEMQMAHFWDPAEDLDSFPLTINPPTVDMPLLKRLGEPNFLAGESLLSLLKPVFDSFTRSALRAAYTEEEPVESNPATENGNGN
ncbi:MAG: SWIM zinc finger family protein, partial [Anaerolineaceae bacterium]|nr:SWIM zinc finger family protein [Anaerolineaceae bacterium]